MKTIKLKNKHIDYSILIGNGIYKSTGSILKKYLIKKRVFIICDLVVFNLYEKNLSTSLKRSKIEAIFIPIKVDERKKNIATVSTLSSKLCHLILIVRIQLLHLEEVFLAILLVLQQV
jgi:3-dehydroquinate synthetase